MGMKNSRWLSLIVLCSGFLLIVVDMTIVNVALPSIQKDLGFTQSGLAWVINAYLIAFGGLLLLAGRLGDLVGRRRVFLAGLALFTAASLLCGLSLSQPMLIAARFVQGVGGAVSSAVILAMIVTLFPEPLERAKAFGIFSFIASAGAAVGLLAGGLITQAVSWHWIFFVNLPIGVITAVMAARVIEPDRGIGLGEGADVLGAAMVTLGLMLGVYTIVQTSEYDLMSGRTVVLGATTVALLASFVLRQARVRNPILPLRVFRSRRVAGANVVQALMSTAFIGFFFLGSLDLERVLGYRPMEIGLAFLPVAVVMALFSIRFSAQLIARFGPGAMLATGQAIAAVGLLIVGLGPTHADYTLHLLAPMIMFGLGGGGLSFPALTMIAMADVAPAEAGLASGLLNTTGQVGGAFGLAVLATIAGSRTVDLVRGGADTGAALAGGYHLAWIIGAGVVVVTLVVAALTLRAPRQVAEAVDMSPDECEAVA
ncbi:MAG TPA: DHA2 family efflux MFS transporter permease subunit [Candidatus Limnocylindrales bacterium]|nr:DHA2 family efflux MFS transporter permease subunit [Candidatus Limnocylindrales bacterium]